MKIKAVAALCSKVKQIVLYHEAGRQWAGDGMSAYLLPEAMGTLSTGALTAIFDIPTDKAADMLIRDIPMPEPYDTEDEGEEEEELRFDLASSITYNGTELLPLMTPDGRIYFIKIKYLRPITDCEGLRLSLRRTDGGQSYVAAKDGMFLVAIIMPLLPKDYMQEWLCDLHQGAEKTESREKVKSDGEL